MDRGEDDQKIIPDHKIARKPRAAAQKTSAATKRASKASTDESRYVEIDQPGGIPDIIFELRDLTEIPVQHQQSTAAHSRSQATTAPSTSDAQPRQREFTQCSREEREFWASADVGLREALETAASTMTSITPGMPLRFRVLLSKLPTMLKWRINAKLLRLGESVSLSLPSGDVTKFTTWVETLLSVPLGVRLQAAALGGPSDLERRVAWARSCLDEAVYGNAALKQVMLERFFLWTTQPKLRQRPLALVGPPGSGKTTLVQSGLAKIMQRPFSFISLGGQSDSSFLVGHSYTYEGSTYGRVAEAVVSAGVENPVLYFDELDKVSSSPKGEEIVNVLIHLTDTVQNDAFQDRYLAGLNLDLSGAFLVFSLNDINSVSRVLIDRLQLVHVDVFTGIELRSLVTRYLLPSVAAEHGLSSSFFGLEEEALKYLCDRSSEVCRGGVRQLRAALASAAAKLSMWSQISNSSLIAPLRVEDFVIREGTIILSRAGIERIWSDLTRASDGGGLSGAALAMYG
jgi:ATP-dependent Lon protease